jgi:hypothetical protein
MSVSHQYKFTADTKARMVNGSTWNGDGVDYDWIVDSRESIDRSCDLPAVLS